MMDSRRIIASIEGEKSVEGLDHDDANLVDLKFLLNNSSICVRHLPKLSRGRGRKGGKKHLRKFEALQSNAGSLMRSFRSDNPNK